MESLRLDGTTIRGLVKGRPVNCIVRSVPDGLVLPPGQYVLRVGENNPIYGLFLAVEAAGAPGAAASALKWTPDTAPGALKHSPAAVATLVPTTKPAYSAIIKEVPGGKLAATALKYVPAAKFDAPAAKFDAPAAKFDAPASRVGAPASKVDAPATKAVDAPAPKVEYVPGRGMTARVIIAIRPIGQNCLVAQAGFSDLVDAVQQAGGVTLIVS
jgi:hypothetical protein